MIKLEGVVKSFPPEQVVLNGINLEVEKGEWVWLLGVTGVGKSVLVKLVSGALSVDAGKVTVLGEDVPGLNEARLALLRRRIGIVFQDLRLLDDRPAIQNISLVLWALGVPRKESLIRAEAYLDRVGLGKSALRCPYELSIGQRQKLALARALAKEPELLLLDEPFSALDSTEEREMLKLLGEVNHKGVTILAVSHEHEVLHFLPGRVLELKQGGIE